MESQRSSAVRCLRRRRARRRHELNGVLASLCGAAARSAPAPCPTRPLGGLTTALRPMFTATRSSQSHNSLARASTTRGCGASLGRWRRNMSGGSTMWSSTLAITISFICIASVLPDSPRAFHCAQVRAQALDDCDELGALLARDALAVFSAELLGHVIHVVDHLAPGFGDRDELHPAVVAPTRALDQPLALEPLDQRARGGLAHAEPPGVIGLGQLLGAIEVDQRRHLALVETGAAEAVVVDAQLQSDELGEQELELLIRVAPFHEACLVWHHIVCNHTIYPVRNGGCVQ